MGWILKRLKIDPSMNEQERRKPSFGDPRPNSPVSIISRFSYEEYRDSNQGGSPHPGHEARASRESSISGSSQLTPNPIDLARPLSAAMISSNDRFTSSAASDLAKGNGLDSTEQIIIARKPAVTMEPYKQHRTKSDEEKGQKMWNPFWLWPTTLIGFILILFLLVMALVVLYHFSNLRNGLSTQNSRDHYSWTYGPTAGGSILK